MLNLQTPFIEQPKTKSSAEPPVWEDIRNSANALYETLARAWSCSQDGDVRHLAKLYLETERTEADIEMSLAVLCQKCDVTLSHPEFIELSVKTQPVGPPSDATLRYRIIHCEADAPLSLEDPRDLCSEFSIRYGPKAKMTKRCPGHIQLGQSAIPTGRYQHLVGFPSGCLVGKSCTSFASPSTLVGMEALISKPGEDSLSTIDKLKMAWAMALAVLKFEATPWLGQLWRIEDLSFFHKLEKGLDQSLRTLHLGVEFNPENLRQVETGSVNSDTIMSSQS